MVTHVDFTLKCTRLMHLKSTFSNFRVLAQVTRWERVMGLNVCVMGHDVETRWGRVIGPNVPVVILIAN